MSTIYKILSDIVERRKSDIDDWFLSQQKAPGFFYHSVDIRHSGFKLAPVDTNLFPAGFNNLSPKSLVRAKESARDYINKNFTNIERIIVITESHTRNTKYHENLHILKIILENAKNNVLFFSPAKEVIDTGVIKILPLGQLKAGNDLIILNNDLTIGVPEELKNISVPIVPGIDMGWHKRRKHLHALAYNKIAQSFAANFSFDPWLISTVNYHCGMVNFQEKEGLECIAIGIEKTLRIITEKYKEHGIKEEPYVFVKADQGTYGMGIMTAKSGNEVYEMNKKLRNKMSVIKEGLLNTEVIIQEGILTIDTIDNKVAEPMIYIVNNMPVAIIYRINEARDKYGNLNASGMSFSNICDETDSSHCPYKPLSLVARLAALATYYE